MRLKSLLHGASRPPRGRMRGKAWTVLALTLFCALALASSAAAAGVPTNTAPPTISGTPQEAQMLTESHGTWTDSPTSYTYQWRRCDSTGANCISITGATAQTYVLTSLDVGHTIRVQETAANASGTSAPATSVPTAKITTKPVGFSATTEAAAGITVTAVTLNGVAATGGQAVTWQFQYGRSTTYDKGTPIQKISAGHGTVAVSWRLTGLSPDTTYHFRITVTNNVTIAYGKDLTFTTSPTGKLLLTSRQLTVTDGFLLAKLKCASQLACVGRYSVNTRARLAGTHKFATVICATPRTTLFRISAGNTKTVKSRVSKACLALLRAAKHHRITAKFTSRPRTGQSGVIKRLPMVVK